MRQFLFPNLVQQKELSMRLIAKAYDARRDLSQEDFEAAELKELGYGAPDTEHFC